MKTKYAFGLSSLAPKLILKRNMSPGKNELHPKPFLYLMFFVATSSIQNEFTLNAMILFREYF